MSFISKPVAGLIMIFKEEAHQKIAALIERFHEQKESYKRADYNETLTRRDFIDPFFKALGWDINNEQGYAESYREVIHEDKIKIGGATKAPDYSFRLPGGKRLFFVEAKKPSVYIKGDITPAYQVRRYGWSAKLPISIITDFEEFAIYDCTKKPNPTDKASNGRINYLTYQQYLDEFDFIWNTFSKEKVLKGSFDKFLLGNKNKKGTTTVDREFLTSLDNWRSLIATNIALRNTIDADELNFVVQHIIDRIIFLRIAEDRRVEHYGTLKEAISEGNYYENLLKQFYTADQKYNSGLFDFKKDKISANIQIDNKVVKSIINDLYYPVSPYEFSVISVEILGSAYEQFLGKTISLSKSGRAVIEEKPEVRKAGGVYYTPEYIVEYIVKQTVGKKIEDLEKRYASKASPAGGGLVGAISKIKIVDPACGSGSFLIGAYQYLLDYHKDYYTNNGKPGKGAKGNPLTPDGNLTTAEKKRILLNNIYGVDLDDNAVEVTKLSLLLKCMEGETEASITTQLQLFHERVLPSLDGNIKSGNSLIDIDFYSSEIDFGEERKIKPFSWKKAFPEVFQQGGFDCVIGNPPYVRQELLGNQKPYFQCHSKVYHGMADLYSYFIEKGIGLLNDHGIFGIIVANKWMRANYGEPLRRWLKQQGTEQIIDFGDLPVFQGATTYPCILISSKEKTEKEFSIVNVKTLAFDSLSEYVAENSVVANRTTLEDSGWNLAGDVEQKLLKKLREAGVPLGEYVKGQIFYGIKTGLNAAFVIDSNTRDRLIREDPGSVEVIKPFLAGRDIKRYQPPQSDKYLIFFPKGFTNEKGKNPRSGWKWLQENYPAIARHLEPFQFAGEKRYDKGEYWWELRACDYYGEFEKPKIMLPDIALKMQATFDNSRYYCVNTAYIIPVADKNLLGLINSSLIHFYYIKLSSTIRGGYLRFIRQYLETIPVIISGNDISNLVDQLLQLNEEKQQTTLPSKIAQLQNRIDYCEKKVDEIVYELYGLTEEEVRMVEKG